MRDYRSLGVSQWKFFDRGIKSKTLAVGKPTAVEITIGFCEVLAHLRFAVIILFKYYLKKENQNNLYYFLKMNQCRCLSKVLLHSLYVIRTFWTCEIFSVLSTVCFSLTTVKKMELDMIKLILLELLSFCQFKYVLSIFEVFSLLFIAKLYSY